MRIARRLVPALVLAALSGSAWGQCVAKVPPGSLVQPGKLQLAINPTLPHSSSWTSAASCRA